MVGNGGSELLIFVRRIRWKDHPAVTQAVVVVSPSLDSPLIPRTYTESRTDMMLGVIAMQFVIVPGIDNSDEQHWQSIWEAEWGPAATRIAVASRTSPELDDWVGAIERAVRMARTPDVVLVAHSVGCWAAASWVANRGSDARGVFLVSPPDQDGDFFRAVLSSFTAVVPEPLELPGLMVSSDDDPYCAPQVAEQLAAGWGIPRIGVGRLGHINSSSGIGSWDQGRALLTAFTAGLRAPSTESRRGSG